MNQHTVPKFLLRNFTKDKKHRIWAYDKHNGTRFRPNIRNVASEKGFYDLPADAPLGGSLEAGLQQIEDRAAPILREVVGRKNIALLDNESREDLAVFFATLFARTKEHRLRYDHLGQLVRGYDPIR